MDLASATLASRRRAALFGIAAAAALSTVGLVTLARTARAVTESGTQAVPVAHATTWSVSALIGILTLALSWCCVHGALCLLRTGCEQTASGGLERVSNGLGRYVGAVLLAVTLGTSTATAGVSLTHETDQLCEPAPSRDAAGEHASAWVPQWQPLPPSVPTPTRSTSEVSVTSREQAPDPASPPVPSQQRRTVVVLGGDTLWSIAARDLGATATPAETSQRWRQWYRANRATIGADPDLILPGQVLSYPPRTPPLSAIGEGP